MSVRAFVDTSLCIVVTDGFRNITVTDVDALVLDLRRAKADRDSTDHPDDCPRCLGFGYLDERGVPTLGSLLVDSGLDPSLHRCKGERS